MCPYASMYGSKLLSDHACMRGRGRGRMRMRMRGGIKEKEYAVQTGTRERCRWKATSPNCTAVESTQQNCPPSQRTKASRLEWPRCLLQTCPSSQPDIILTHRHRRRQSAGSLLACDTCLYLSLPPCHPCLLLVTLNHH